METLDLGIAMAAAANDKKASRIMLFDLRKQSDLCEYLLICSGTSDRQTGAVADGIELAIKSNFQIRPRVIEGKQAGEWVLMDYGHVVVHIFLDSIRDFYAIEKLCVNAPQVPLKLT